MQLGSGSIHGGIRPTPQLPQLNDGSRPLTIGSEDLSARAHSLVQHDLFAAIELVDHHWRYNPQESILPAVTRMVVDAACNHHSSCAPIVRCVSVLPRIEDRALKSGHAMLLARALLAWTADADNLEVLPLPVLVDLLEALGSPEGAGHELSVEVQVFGSTASAYLLESVVRLGEPEKEQLVARLMRLEQISGFQLIELAQAIQSITGEGARRALQHELSPRLVEAAVAAMDGDADFWAYGVLQLYGAAIAIDGGSPALIDGVLRTLPRSWDSALDLAALLTFQIDPEGKAMRPGTERRDEGNALNPDQLVGGTPFTYPHEIATRRRILETAGSVGITGRIAHTISPIPLHLLDLAQISESYAGHPVQPSDWPRLLQVLQEARR